MERLEAGGAAWHRRRTQRPWTRKALGGRVTSTPPISGCSHPNTGNYEPRLNRRRAAADDTAGCVRRSRSPGRDGAADPEPRGRRRAAKREPEKEKATGPVSRRKPKPKKSKTKKALYWGRGTLAFLLVGGLRAAYFVYSST